MSGNVEELRKNLALFIAVTLGFELDDDTVLAVLDIVQSLDGRGAEYLTEVIKSYRENCSKLEKNLKLDLLRYVAKRAGVEDWFDHKYAIYEDTPEFRVLRKYAEHLSAGATDWLLEPAGELPIGDGLLLFRKANGGKLILPRWSWLTEQAIDWISTRSRITVEVLTKLPTTRGELLFDTPEEVKKYLLRVL